MAESTGEEDAERPEGAAMHLNDVANAIEERDKRQCQQDDDDAADKTRSSAPGASRVMADNWR